MKKMTLAEALAYKKSWNRLSNARKWEERALSEGRRASAEADWASAAALRAQHQEFLRDLSAGPSRCHGCGASDHETVEQLRKNLADKDTPYPYLCKPCRHRTADAHMSPKPTSTW